MKTYTWQYKNRSSLNYLCAYLSIGHPLIFLLIPYYQFCLFLLFGNFRGRLHTCHSKRTGANPVAAAEPAKPMNVGAPMLAAKIEPAI